MQLNHQFAWKAYPDNTAAEVARIACRAPLSFIAEEASRIESAAIAASRDSYHTQVGPS